MCYLWDLQMYAKHIILIPFKLVINLVVLSSMYLWYWIIFYLPSTWVRYDKGIDVKKLSKWRPKNVLLTMWWYFTSSNPWPIGLNEIVWPAGQLETTPTFGLSVMYLQILKHCHGIFCLTMSTSWTQHFVLTWSR